MSSNTTRPQAPRPDGMRPTAYRQDDERRRDEARVVGLQNQVDELRQALREIASRQGREEELLKQYEGNAAQNRLAIEQLRQEGQQSAQARALDENRTRQQVADLETRLHDVARPIRSLQAHVLELLEAARRKTDDTSQYRQRDDELQEQIEHLSAHVDRTSVMIHQLRDSVDSLRGESDQVRRDVMRAEDGIKIVDQEGRRRTTEIEQASENVSSRIDELRSDLGHLFDLVDDTRRSIVHIDPAIEELRGIDTTLRQDLARFQTQTNERHELLLERAEDARQETDTQISDVRQAQEQRHERLTDRIEELGEAHRELGFRITALSGHLDELRLVDVSLRRELWILNEQRVRLRLEQAQQELDQVASQRRDAEAETPATRPRRQLDH
jgi:chromosome segregation ATPase